MNIYIGMLDVASRWLQFLHRVFSGVPIFREMRIHRYCHNKQKTLCNL